MVDEIVAKFRVSSVNTIDSGNKEHPILYNLMFAPVYDGSAENKEFFKWTPSGYISLGTLNEKAADFFIPKEEFAKLTQQEYYVTFTKAPKIQTTDKCKDA